MKRRIILTIFLYFSFCQFLYAEEKQRIVLSESFINDINLDDTEYKNKMDLQIDEYQKITKEEFRKLRSKIKSLWGDSLLTSQSRWVYYSYDLKTRSIVEFESGIIKIESLSDMEIIDDKFFKNKIVELLSLNIEAVFRSNHLIIAIEKRMKEKNLNAVYDNDFDEPIVALIATDEYILNDDNIYEKSDEILSKGRISKYKNNKGNEVYYFQGKIITHKIYPYGKVNRNAYKYKKYIDKYSQEFKIPNELIYAIIHNESSFNPFATSYIPAYGLMQVVPMYAGRTASAIIFEREIILSPSYLYDYSNNIMIGTAYLSKVYHEYFKGIKDTTSRLYCTIAAYNTGIGNVSRAFTGIYNLKKAILKINTLNNQQVYERLITNLPYKETRQYLQKVIKSYNAYKGH